MAALAIGFALGLQAERPGIFISRMVGPTSFDVRPPLGSQFRGSRRVHLASLETGFASGAAIGDEEMPSETAASTRVRGSFNRLFLAPRLDSFLAPRLDSFDERFAGADASLPTADTTETEEEADGVLLPPEPGELETASLAVGQSAPDLAPVTSPLAGVAKKRLRTAAIPKESSSPPDADGRNADARTAIYDITAHKVYLPNGKSLEAHSGLGSHMDDPRYVNVKSRGPTPPNVYDLVLRERLFHGVRAIRLIPVDDGKMFGRDGILAHSYMLGPNGQSNGCVSFNDYPAFLNAYLKGEIDRLVVVEHLDNPPDSATAWRWLPDTIKSFFTRS